MGVGLYKLAFLDIKIFFQMEHIFAFSSAYHKKIIAFFNTGLFKMCLYKN